MSTTPERESRTLHQKKPQLDRIYEGYPPKNSGYEGELRIHNIKGEGLRLYIRKNKEWYFSTFSTTGTVATTVTSGGGGSGDITSVTAGTGLSGGGTTGDVTLTNAGVTSNVAGTGISVSAATGAVTISVSGLTVSELAANSLQTSGESFSDNDTSLMTSAAIQDKIQSFSYITLSSLSASTPITYNNSTGAFSVSDHAITLAKLPEIATARFLGRNTSGTGDVEVMTVNQVSALLSLDNYLTAVSQSDVTQHQGAIDHDQLLNFSAAEHVDWASSGAGTIHATNYTDTVDMGDGFRFVYVDGNVQVTENKYLKLKTVDGSRGFGSLESGNGSSSSPWIITLPTPDTNTTYSVMGSGNSYAAGLVLAGSATHNNTFLRKDGSWQLPNINLQDDDSDSVSVTINSHVKITGSGGISTDWTTNDAGGAGNSPNVLTIGLGNITQVGALSQGSIASGFTTIDEGFIDADIVRKNANTTITGNYTFSGKGIIINAGSGNDITGYDASLYITATSSNDWGMWINKASYNYGLKVDTAADATRAIVVRSSSTNRFIVDGAGVVTWNGGGSANANTAYSWGDHGTEGYLKNITGESIDELSNVNSISGISNGQVLVYSTGNYYEPVTFTSSYSWYLRDGDNTEKNITSGKYIKFVEGTGIDIDFINTSNTGAIDSAHEIQFTNTLMSGGNISGTLTTTGNLGVGISSPTTHYEQVVHVHESSGSSAVHLTNNTTGSTANDGTDIIAYQDDFYIWNRESGGHVIIGTNATERFRLESGGNAQFTGDVLISGNRTLRVGGTGSETASILVLGGDNSAGSRVALQANSDNSYLDAYGGEGSTERYRDFTYAARSHTFRTSSSSSLGTVLTMDSSQVSTFSGKLRVAGAGAATSWHNISVDTGGFLGQYNNSSGIGVYCASNHNELFYYNYGAGAYASGIVTFGSLDFKYNNSTSLLNLTSSVSIFGNTIRTSTNTDYAQLLGKQGGLEVRSSRSTDVGIAVSTSSGSFRIQLYGASTSYGFLDGFWAGWDLKKTVNGELILYGSGSNSTQIGSADEWGRLQFNDHSNGTYVYLNQGDFRVDGGHWNPYGNADTNLGSDSLRWNNIWINSVAQVGQLKLNNNFKWEQGTNAYGRFSDWLQGGGTHGIFFPNTSMTSSPHFFPVSTGNSYGTFYVSGHQQQWAGILYTGHSTKPTWMHRETHGGGGLYYQGSSSWAIYWDVGNGCFGVDGSTTSSSYSLYVSGAIYSTGDVVAFSDSRVKTNVVTIDNPLDKVLSMRGVYYNPIDKETKEVDDRRRVGVIAQELNEVLPEAVTYAEDVDEYGVDYGKLTGVLIEAIKELKQEINELKGN